MAKKDTAALEVVRKTDPTARVLWEVQGPRDEGSRIQGLLTRKDASSPREVVLAVLHDDGSFSFFDERRMPPQDEGKPDAGPEHN